MSIYILGCDCSDCVPDDPCAAKPVITSSFTTSCTCGDTCGYQITATGSPTSFGASGMPSGCSINTSTGEITISRNDYGTYPFTISATNACGTGTATLTLTITCTCDVQVDVIDVIPGGGTAGGAYWCLGPSFGVCPCTNLVNAFTVYFAFKPTNADFISYAIEASSDCSAWAAVCTGFANLGAGQVLCCHQSIPAGYQALRMNLSGTPGNQFRYQMYCDFSLVTLCGSAGGTCC